METAKLLRKQRTKLKLTQKEVASWFHLSNPQMISNIERGMCPYPKSWIPLLSRKFQLTQKELWDAFLRYQMACNEKKMKRRA